VEKDNTQRNPLLYPFIVIQRKVKKEWVLEDENSVAQERHTKRFVVTVVKNVKSLSSLLKAARYTVENVSKSIGNTK